MTWGEQVPPPGMAAEDPAASVRRLVELYHAELAASAASAAESTAPIPDALPEVDLRTLVAEMTALKAEIRKETLHSRELAETATRATERVQGMLELHRKREAELLQNLDRFRAQTQREHAAQLIAVADRLEPALDGVRRLTGRRWRWLRRRKQVALESLVDGIGLTLQRIEQGLAEIHVERVIALGQSFDPSTMEAVGVAHQPGAAEGLVVQEVTSGYRTAEGPIRLAQVIVNRAAPAETA